MANSKAQFGAQLTQMRGRLLDRLDAVVQIEGLSTTLDLASQRACNLLVVVLTNVRVNGAASTRWRGDDRDIPQSSKRHVQSARNRRGREREHIDLGAHLPQQLLLSHTKTLLLIDDHEPKIGRDNVA